MIKRELYLEKLRNSYDSELIKVITMDKINYSQNGIIHMNIEEFLLKK